MIDPRFKRGLELFNNRKFYECHDAIEELWLETSSEDEHRELYQGVIQAAAALYQYERGILKGARTLYESSTMRLEKYAPHALGLNVERMLEDMKVCFADLQYLIPSDKIRLQDRFVPKLQYEFED